MRCAVERERVCVDVKIFMKFFEFSKNKKFEYKVKWYVSLSLSLSL